MLIAYVYVCIRFTFDNVCIVLRIGIEPTHPTLLIVLGLTLALSAIPVVACLFNISD